MGFSVPMVVPALPKHTKLHTVVGRPIPLPAIESPSLEDVVYWHGQYVVALQDLFDKYQPELAPKITKGLTFSDAKL